MNPTVSVIFPTYNRPNYLREAVDSILTQEFADFELLIVDHGSGPETAAILSSYSDPRMRTWRFEENRGSEGCPFCFLGAQAKGRYIVLFSDDDRILPGFLEKRVCVLDAHPECGFVYGSAEIINGQGKRTGRHDFGQPKEADDFDSAPFRELFIGNRICMPSGMFRREFMPLFKQPFAVLNDWAFWLEIAHRSKGAFLRHPTLEYRIWDGSDSKKEGARNGDFLRMYPRIWKRWMEVGHRPSESDYKRMLKNIEALAEQQIALLKEEFPPARQPVNLLSLLS